MALEAEMAKPEPDAAVAAGLQKELSALKADVGQKRLAHRIEMKKIHPELGKTFRPGKRVRITRNLGHISLESQRQWTRSERGIRIGRERQGNLGKM